MPRLSPSRVYLFIEFAASACFSMMFVVTSLYEATVAGLTPVQLILVGTALEISAFIFEVPTGIVADVYSRRLSIIIGYILMGVGFLVEGLFPAFIPILLAQIVWGLGYTFTSGATQAWITDEIGEDDANKLFLRATRVGLYASLLGMGLAALVGVNNVAMPILVGAIGVLLIGVILIFIMPEKNFHPTPREDRNTWQHMWHTFRQGADTVRSKPRLMSIVGVGLFYGIYSEGFDRLWVKHLLDQFSLPILFGNNQVGFFAVLRAAGALLTILAVHLVEKRVDSTNSIAIGRAMLVVTGLISVAMLGFALSPFLLLSLGLYLIIDALRDVRIPLQTAWVNQKLDSKVRATVHSMFGQVDAIGQMLGGPVVAVIAALGSTLASLVTSSLLLTPALFFVSRANSNSAEDAETISPLPGGEEK
ncbi:MAG TPA: MFS transporter [Anaerolineales bacterium]|nr:MFS transporter [Anaerolineales bacterium]HMS01085.1 MFS transporter [Anaerolineales bacterium]HNQ94604.1 MFS transporter [Anaerolineales bacterium]HNS60036.1 MFS transporter [Anaerolineales bacterium]